VAGKYWEIGSASSSGSTPRKVGARMLVHPDGRSEFTLGGGPFEAMVIEDAREAAPIGTFFQVLSGAF